MRTTIDEARATDQRNGWVTAGDVAGRHQSCAGNERDGGAGSGRRATQGCGCGELPLAKYVGCGVYTGTTDAVERPTSIFPPSAACIHTNCPLQTLDFNVRCVIAFSSRHMVVSPQYHHSNVHSYARTFQLARWPITIQTWTPTLPCDISLTTRSSKKQTKMPAPNQTPVHLTVTSAPTKNNHIQRLPNSETISLRTHYRQYYLASTIPILISVGHIFTTINPSMSYTNVP